MALDSLLNRFTKKSADKGVTGPGQDEGVTGAGQDEGVTGLGQDEGVTGAGQDKEVTGLRQNRMGYVLLLLLLDKRLSKLLMFLKLYLQIMQPGMAEM